MNDVSIAKGQYLYKRAKQGIQAWKFIQSLASPCWHRVVDTAHLHAIVSRGEVLFLISNNKMGFGRSESSVPFIEYHRHGSGNKDVGTRCEHEVLAWA